MNKLTLTTCILMFSAASFAAETYLRLPVLVRDTRTDKIYPAAQIKSLKLPATITIDQRADAHKLMAQLQKKLTGGQYEIAAYTEIKSYLNKIEARFQLCYVGNPRQAIDLMTTLGDSFLSDQLQINFYRVSGETVFHRTYENHKPVLVGDEEYSTLRPYLRTRLSSGQIQTVTAYTDDGDDSNVDIIGQCR